MRDVTVEIEVSSLIDFVSNAIVHTAGAPCSRVQVLLQCQEELLKAGRLSAPYRGIVDCVLRTSRSEGFFSFWKGNLTACLRELANLPLNSTAARWGHRLGLSSSTFLVGAGFSEDSATVNVLTAAAAGGTAHLIATPVSYPLLYCQVRLISDVKLVSSGVPERQFKSIRDVFRQTLKADGLVGLYRGVPLFIAHGYIESGLRIFLPNLVERFGEKIQPLSAPLALSMGGTLLATAHLFVYPLTTVYYRLMLTSGSETGKYRGSADCFREIVRHEGVRALWRGASVAFVHHVYCYTLLLGLLSSAF